MKKLMLILIALATLQVSAQDQKRTFKKEYAHKKVEFSPEQTAQLRAKQMTLRLELNDKQQNELSALFLEEAKARQSRKEAFSKLDTPENVKKFSGEARFQMANAKLDQQINRQRKLKTILTPEQYAKWSKMSEKRMGQRNFAHKPSSQANRKFNYMKRK